MAGFSKAYFIGHPGGFMGSDGLNPILFEILVGDADRQWLEPVYVSCKPKPLGKIQKIIPKGPDDPDSLIDACIAFCPQLFETCPKLGSISAELEGVSFLDFNTMKNVPSEWEILREEAKEKFAGLSVFLAKLIEFPNKT